MGALAEQLDLSKMSDQELEFYYFKYEPRAMVLIKSLKNLLNLLIIP